MKDMKNKLLKSRQEKLTEKAFTQSITISVFGILLCIIALCSVTWAWFSEGVSSSTNSIQSATCDVSVAVTTEGADVVPVDGKYTFYKDKAYTIKLTATGTAKTAYCVLNIGGTNYYTVQIPTDAVTTENFITFTLQFTTDTPNVEIYTYWGTSSQSERDFANGLHYLDCKVTDPATLVVTPTPTEPTNATETTPTTESAETEAPSPEVTE